MLRRLVVFALFVQFGPVAAPLFAQDKEPKQPTWTHAFDLACRKYGELTFTDKTQKFGVEVFKDNNNGFGIYVSQVGSFAWADGFEDVKGTIEKSEGPKWITGLDLPARKAGVKEFSKDTRVWGLEVFLDPNTNNWMYVTERGKIGVARKRSNASSTRENPKWVASVDLRVRKAGDTEWKDAQKFGIEIYRDPNTANLIYICENGSFAVVEDTSGGKEAEGKAPSWLHSLELKVRKHDEKSFGKDTKQVNIEVFRDENNGNLIYITETGEIAVLPNKKDLKAPTVDIKDPVWTHGLNLKCRRYGEELFSDATRVFGAEVFKDVNTGGLICIVETGDIAVIEDKK